MHAAAKLRVRVHAIRRVAGGIHEFELRSQSGSAMPDWEPGAHTDLQLPNTLVRSYSLIGPEESRDAYRIAVGRDPDSRGGSAWMHERLRVEDELEISEPRNDFPLHPGAAHSVLIAGGIGITPIVGMAERLHRLRCNWVLHYCVRSRDRAAYLDRLAPLGERVHLHVDAAPGAPDLQRIVGEAPAATHFYACGPASMMSAYQRATRAIAPAHVHAEYFSSDLAPAVAGGYRVELVRSGRSFEIPPGSTILQVLRTAGVDVGFTCEQGVCGTCETVVLQGRPDHRDRVLSEEERAEGNTMMICCSGSRTDLLVLDL